MRVKVRNTIYVEALFEETIPDLAADTITRVKYFSPARAIIQFSQDNDEEDWSSPLGVTIEGPARKNNGNLANYWHRNHYGSLHNPLPMEVYDLLQAHGDVPVIVKQLLTTMVHKATPTRPHRA